MSEKERISATVDPEIADYLQQEHVNASGLINRAVRESMSGNDIQFLKLRRDLIDGEIATLESQLEARKSEREQINERIQQHKEETDSIIREAAETLSPRDLDRNEQIVRNWARDADMPQDEFEAALREEWSKDE